MNDERRNKRLRLLISRLNKERKKQAKQIDILCNDFVAAQKDFIKALNTIGFAADFYEAIAGLTELNELLFAAGNLIKDQIPDANVAFFLLAPSTAEGMQHDNFELHIFESDQPIDLEDRRIENFFTAELVGNIAKSNRICTIEDMLAMGLAGSPVCLEKISTAAIPLSTPASSMGFVLIYRSSRNQLTADELKAVAQITPGLGRSIASCRALVSSI
ncbi:MAG: hypothetical protein IMZ61_09295 [Planctomycetes bacterium]|nr:hypothetical protein [Planctomycetota bacterium]